MCLLIYGRNHADSLACPTLDVIIKLIHPKPPSAPCRLQRWEMDGLGDRREHWVATETETDKLTQRNRPPREEAE